MSIHWIRVLLALATPALVLACDAPLPTAAPAERAPALTPAAIRFVGPASTTLVYDFEGEFYNVFDAFGVLGGLTEPVAFTGNYAYDPATPDTDPDPFSGDYASETPGSGLTLSFDVFSIVASPLVIRTSNEPPTNPADLLAIRTDMIAPSGWIFSVLFDFAKGSPSDFLTSDALPTEPPDLALPDLVESAKLVGGPDSRNFGALNLDGVFTSITLRHIEVPIVIRPGDTPDSGSPGLRGAMLVAILGTAAFDATSVVPKSLRLDGVAARTHPNGQPMVDVEDVNGDDWPDLVAYFEAAPLGLVRGTRRLTLHGLTTADEPIVGTDIVEVRSR